eukprot:5635694-Lingulodinium_polyedra.AAC.1
MGSQGAGVLSVREKASAQMEVARRTTRERDVELLADARARKVWPGPSWKWAATHNGGPLKSMWGINALRRS